METIDEGSKECLAKAKLQFIQADKTFGRL